MALGDRISVGAGLSVRRTRIIAGASSGEYGSQRIGLGGYATLRNMAPDGIRANWRRTVPILAGCRLAVGRLKRCNPDTRLMGSAPVQVPFAAGLVRVVHGLVALGETRDGTLAIRTS